MWGQVATGKVTVDLYTHFGTPKMEHKRKQIPISERDAIVNFDLADGRRTEALADAQIAETAATQIAANGAVLAQQLAAVDPFSSDSGNQAMAPVTAMETITCRSRHSICRSFVPELWVISRKSRFCPSALR